MSLISSHSVHFSGHTKFGYVFGIAVIIVDMVVGIVVGIVVETVEGMVV